MADHRMTLAELGRMLTRLEKGYGELDAKFDDFRDLGLPLQMADLTRRIAILEDARALPWKTIVVALTNGLILAVVGYFVGKA